MKSSSKYAVYGNHEDEPIGYFLDGKYFEPFIEGRKVGHLDSEDNFFYYPASEKNTQVKPLGKINGDTLVRNEDGVRLKIKEI